MRPSPKNSSKPLREGKRNVSGSGPSTPACSSVANVVLRLGSVHVGAMPTLHAVSGDAAVLTSSAWPPSPMSAAALPVLGVFDPSVDEPLTVVPAMFPEASSWRTSSAVIAHGEPSTRVQSLDAASFTPGPLVHPPYSA